MMIIILRDVISARIRGALRALFVRLRLCANGARDNANVTRRSHYQKSLLHDNDRAVFCAKLVTIYVDWIALLRRLLNDHKNVFIPKLWDSINYKTHNIWHSILIFTSWFLRIISYACHIKCNQWISEKNTCPTPSHILHMKFNGMCYKVESFVTLLVSLFSLSFSMSLSKPLHVTLLQFVTCSKTSLPIYL